MKVNSNDYHIIEVGWLGELAEVFIGRRHEVEGDTYAVVLNDMLQVFFGPCCVGHDESDRRMLPLITEYLNDEDKARKGFYIWK